ncbi:MAG: PorV/PorQ family protein [Candidatus Poribacteria bacterium]|nr:PorV/PorQ family protein [Candidatus Poribacteria bacterium]
MHNTNFFQDRQNYRTAKIRKPYTQRCRISLFSILVLVTVLLLSTIPSYATTNVGTAGAQFLKIGPGARVDSLGGAFGAIANDVTTIYWNPAGLSQLEKTSFSDTHTIWLADVRYNYLAFATPIEKVGTLGASVTFLNVPDTEITTLAKPDGTELWYSAWDTAVSLAYSRELYQKESGANLSFGINAKYIHQQIHRESARGVAIDVGTLYHTGWRSLRIGMSFSNFGPEMSFSGTDLETGVEEAGDKRTADYHPFPDTTNPTRKAELETIEYPLPSNFRLGVAYDLVDNDSNLLTIALDGNHPNDNSERLNLGVEYWYRKMAAIRAGYKFRLGPDRSDDEEGLTLGLGIHLKFRQTTLSLDYAYADFDYLQNAHRVSLGLNF